MMGQLAVVLMAQLADTGAQGLLEVVSQAPPGERFFRASELFVGRPYANSPLGEGVGVDADPLVRFDAFDCLTLVETSLALSLSTSEDELQSHLNFIRYENAHVAWTSRLHVMESQWIPTQEKRGLIKNVSVKYAGARVQRATKVISAATWREKMGQGLHLPVEKQTVGSFSFDMVPVEHLPSVLASAPSGLLLAVLRKDRPKDVTQVTHVVILVQKKSGAVIRHASRSHKKVVEEPLATYLKRNLDFSPNTILGFALFEVATSADDIFTRQ
jgi:Protein of unknown function (DUF1460)